MLKSVRTRTKRFVRKYKYITIATLVVLAIGSTSAYFLISSKNNSNAAKAKAATADQKKVTSKDKKQATAEDATTATTSATTEPAATGTGTGSSAPASGGSSIPSGTNAGTTLNLTVAPFLIQSIKLTGVFTQCNSYTTDSNVLNIGDAFAGTNSSLGGQISYTLETEGASSPVAPVYYTATIAPNNYSKSLNPSAGFGMPGFAYTNVNAHAGQRVRYHLTSPNELVSEWVQVC